MRIALVISLVAFSVTSATVAGISRDCLRCICEVAGCDNEIGKCTSNGVQSCGPYMITHSYWLDCDQLGEDYETCTKTKQCSERCVRKYMQKYATSCTGGRTPNCEDYAKIHGLGPMGCQSTDNSYWHLVDRCLRPYVQH